MQARGGPFETGYLPAVKLTLKYSTSDPEGVGNLVTCEEFNLIISLTAKDLENSSIITSPAPFLISTPYPFPEEFDTEGPVF